MTGITGSQAARWHVIVLVAFTLMIGASAAWAVNPEGQLTWGVHVSLAPTWFDPAETQGIITPYLVMYALHDAMVKPMPGQPLAPSLAESWAASEDALTYEFVVRRGAKFHNGDDVTAEDVKFSFERYRGAAHKVLKDRVAAVEIPDAQRVRFKLKQPWPDFLTFYVGATGAGWIVPKKYVERVGDEGYRKAPVGAGPYKFVSFTPGQELTLEAFDQYWRKTPSVRRLVFRVIPDEATRLAALKRGEVDIAYSIRGELAEELQRTKGLTLKPTVIQATLRPLERAAFYKGYAEKSFKNLIQGASGAFGNAATRLEAFVATGGAYVYGSYPDIDALFQEQAAELDHKRREATLHKIQRLVHERAIYAHLWQLGFINGVGPRVGESGLGLISGHAYSAPYEDVTLAGK